MKIKFKWIKEQENGWKYSRRVGAIYPKFILETNMSMLLDIIQFSKEIEALGASVNMSSSGAVGFIDNMLRNVENNNITLEVKFSGDIKIMERLDTYELYLKIKEALDKCYTQQIIK